ncbi:MAG: M48 family metalloprotease, partial [Candidatus Cloacimonadales bacterium]
MKKIIYLNLIFWLVLGSVQLLAASWKKIARQQATVRSGPGIFYEKIGSLQQDESVNIQSENNGWLQIDFAESAYISAKALTKPSKVDGIFQQMGSQTTDLQASRHGLSAGIKGFAAKFTKSSGSFEKFQAIMNSNQLQPNLYTKLQRQQAGKYLKKARKHHQLPDGARDQFTPQEIYLGTAFASNIANLGLSQDQQLHDFLNVFGNLIVAATEFYDQRFHFYVLESEKVNAYACPGGIIFLTKGILKSAQNEAELAFVIAHELAHAIRQHGLQEMEERKDLIKSESMFAEMDREFELLGIEQDEKIQKVEEELEAELFDFYETVFSGRLEKYEAEADELGILYLMRSGYAPQHARNILQRLAQDNIGSTNEHYTQEQLLDR